MTSLWFCAVKLHTSRWLCSWTYDLGTLSRVQRRKYDTIVNILRWYMSRTQVTPHQIPCCGDRRQNEQTWERILGLFVEIPSAISEKKSKMIKYYRRQTDDRHWVLPIAPSRLRLRFAKKYTSFRYKPTSLISWRHNSISEGFMAKVTSKQWQNGEKVSDYKIQNLLDDENNCQL